ncbi:MAG: N-acetyl-gamma-glutamyl-phosphate reductase [Elusimicrobia bacterium]|nr:N-acetyl-gamma-glutamyl-phosphate reductase [Elusimicrobiota bacterium]MBI2915823.1 N-acetyl-gamma-glutamyl-phosphate reductase [Elusimicrobiota bacterium]
MTRVSIIGASGYTGGELVRYLLRHPHVAISHCTSESSSGKEISDCHPSLGNSFKKRKKILLEKYDRERIVKGSDLAFVCLPHGSAALVVQQLWEEGLKVVDLSADFRLKSASLYEKWYGIPHPCPSLLKKACYGLPELHRKQIQKSSLVANPGCYATAAILSAYPLAHAGLIQKDSLVIDAKSGVSGAGKKLETRYLFSELNENFLAYSVSGHRHSPEIVQELGGTSLTFVPHLLPITRGILVTVYANLNKKVSGPDLLNLYRKTYQGEPFVSVLPEGTFPEVKSVQNTNFCQIGVHSDVALNRAIVIGVLDNLGKGASSQAVQNMNLMLGLEESSSLA